MIEKERTESSLNFLVADTSRVITTNVPDRRRFYLKS